MIITEINYHSSQEFDSKDWIEFYNPSVIDLDISDWIFKDGEDEHLFVFGKGTIVKGESFIVLSEDTLIFKSFHPNVDLIYGNFEFGLNNSGEKLRLFDNYGNYIDSLTYDDTEPWQVNADGLGYTLQLINYELDNSKSLSWESTLLYGSPGNKNIFVGISDSIKLIPSKYSLSQNYPNPFNPSTTINFTIPKKTNVLLKIYDVLGREIATLIDTKKDAGRYSVVFNAQNHSSGIYFAQLITGNYFNTIKMLLLK